MATTTTAAAPNTFCVSGNNSMFLDLVSCTRIDFYRTVEFTTATMIVSNTLTTAISTFSISRNANLESLSFNSLTYVGGSFIVSTNAKLASLSVRNLITIVQQIHICANNMAFVLPSSSRLTSPPPEGLTTQRKGLQECSYRSGLGGCTSLDICP